LKLSDIRILGERGKVIIFKKINEYSACPTQAGIGGCATKKTPDINKVFYIVIIATKV